MKMITDLFDMEQLRLSDQFVVKTYKDSFYAGEADPKTFERAGFGVCSYNNTRHYEGSWLVDKRHGKGYERFSNGNVYIGDYEKGKVKGKGVYNWTNGDTYDGDWIDGMKHGYGVWKDT
jgi:hypothetical protein